MTDYDQALDAALKVAAPDGGSYQLGAHTFWILMEGVPADDHDVVDVAIRNALLKATPIDWDHWEKAYHAFWTLVEGPKKPSLAERIMSLGSTAKSKAASTSDTKKRSFRVL